MLCNPRDTYIVEYPEAVKFLETQMGIFWFPDEVHVEKDVQDILVNLTEAERHAVITTLKLFTQYELLVGNEYWQQVGAMFQKPACVSRMANCFSFFELNVHAVFYSKINEALGLATDDFYSAYLDDLILKERVESLEQYARDVYTVEDRAAFLAMLALTEGVVLYSSFAFLKHFQSQGKNKILNIVRGINFSARDEGIHSEASAWLFRTLLNEEKGDWDHVLKNVDNMCKDVREHEHQIIDKIFEKGTIEGITATQCKHFVDSRINLVRKNLGLDKMFDVTYDPISSWFYKGINDYQFNDFFSGQGREYVRTWSVDDLRW